MKYFCALILSVAAVHGGTLIATEQSFTYGSGPTATSWTMPAIDFDPGSGLSSSFFGVGIVNFVLPSEAYSFGAAATPDWVFIWNGTQFTVPIIPAAFPPGPISNMAFQIPMVYSGTENLQFILLPEYDILEAQVVNPEPGTWLLMAAGLAFIVKRRIG